jgi:hypothetical protein
MVYGVWCMATQYSDKTCITSAANEKGVKVCRFPPNLTHMPRGEKVRVRIRVRFRVKVRVRVRKNKTIKHGFGRQGGAVSLR